MMPVNVMSAAVALFALMGSATQLAAQPVEVVGHFLDGDDENTAISGIACSGSPGDSVRTCLVALDEGLAAQWATLSLAPAPKLEVGVAVPLFDDSAKAPALLAGIPEVSCSKGLGKFNEHDSEGLSFLADHFFLTGSHGCGRKKRTFKASAFIDVRVAAPTAAEPPVLSTLMNPILSRIDGLTAAYGHDITGGQGISVEGVAGASVKGVVGPVDTLFFGLRSPVLASGAPIVAVDATALFAGGAAPAATLHTADLGGLGVRDLALLDSDPVRLLVLAGPMEGEAGPFRVFLFSPKQEGGAGASTRIADLPVPDNEKAEGLLVVSRDGNRVRVLVVHDGVADGDPTLYDLDLP